MMKTLEDMLEELEEFYECAGFEKYYERCLKGKTEEKILELYEATFKEEDYELEMWERNYNVE